MAGSTEYFIKIYTNDGSTLLKEFYTWLYSTDPILCWVLDTGMSVDIPETNEHEASVEYYTYSGSKKFLGFATTANSSVITHKIGDGFNAMLELEMQKRHELLLYIVEETTKTTKTFDLSTLNLSAGTHTITVKARASGYADSPASNAVSYVVAGEETYTVSGTWVFNEAPTPIGSGSTNIKVNFTSFGGSYRTIRTYNSTSGFFMNYRDTDAGINKRAYTEGEGWRNQAYRTITFDGVQTVSKEFYEWFVANATRQTISFTIDGTSYTALSGMTWGEWVESSYNTGGFNTSHNGWHICAPAYPRFVYDGTNFVDINQTINKGTAYTIKTENMMPT